METKVFGNVTVAAMTRQEYAEELMAQPDREPESARARKLLLDYLAKVANDPGRLAGLVRRTLQTTTDLLLEVERDIPIYQANPQLVRACAKRQRLEEDRLSLEALSYLLDQNLLQAVAADFRKYLIEKLTF